MTGFAFLATGLAEKGNIDRGTAPIFDRIRIGYAADFVPNASTDTGVKGQLFEKMAVITASGSKTIYQVTLSAAEMSGVRINNKALCNANGVTLALECFSVMEGDGEHGCVIQMTVDNTGVTE